MYDCLDTSIHTAETVSSSPAFLEAPTLAELLRRHGGRSWAHFKVKAGAATELARLREVALYLGAGIERLADGSLVVLGLSLSQTLALSERFGATLAVAAHIAGEGEHL